MTSIVKKENPIIVPDALRRRAGIVPGDRVEMKAIGGIITIIAQPRPEPREYTPAQRRVIDARLANSLEDVKKGRTFGPFDTADEMIASIEAELKKRRAAKRNAKRPR